MFKPFRSLQMAPLINDLEQPLLESDEIMEIKLWYKLRKLHIVNLIEMLSMMVLFIVTLAAISFSNKNCIGFKDCLAFNHSDEYQMDRFIPRTLLPFLVGTSGSYIYTVSANLIFTGKSGIFGTKVGLCVITVFYMLSCIGAVTSMMPWKEALVAITGVVEIVGFFLDYIVSLD